ncbi:hypothetical protein VTN02DRAFT_3351 [Thermoascus thermophilus]
MAPFRNFLARKPAPSSGAQANTGNENSRHSMDSRLPSPLSIKTGRAEGPDEYKMSVVNDSGVYLPPSPPEKQSFWHRYPGSTGSSKHRSLVNENEPFSISRESFDSYRRSFDISARSPVSQIDTLPFRTSLDSRFSRMTSRSAVNGSSFSQPQSMEEEHFEDVGLGDEVKPKKKSIFSRFGDSSSDASSSAGSSWPSSSHLGFRIPGRKRAQSGTQGGELSNMNPPPPSTEVGGAV